MEKRIDENSMKPVQRPEILYAYKYHICLKKITFDYHDEKFNRSYRNKKFEKTIQIDNEIRYFELFHQRDEYAHEAFRSLTKKQSVQVHKHIDMNNYK